jgi:hypothetical protein
MRLTIADTPLCQDLRTRFSSAQPFPLVVLDEQSLFGSATARKNGPRR